MVLVIIKTNAECNGSCKYCLNCPICHYCNPYPNIRKKKALSWLVSVFGKQKAKELIVEELI